MVSKQKQAWDYFLNYVEKSVKDLIKGTINHDSPFYEAPKEEESTVKNTWKADPNSIPTVVFHVMDDACINL